jgi:hypothetical protein
VRLPCPTCASCRARASTGIVRSIELMDSPGATDRSPCPPGRHKLTHLHPRSPGGRLGRARRSPCAFRTASTLRSPPTSRRPRDSTHAHTPGKSSSRTTQSGEGSDRTRPATLEATTINARGKPQRALTGRPTRRRTHSGSDSKTEQKQRRRGAKCNPSAGDGGQDRPCRRRRSGAANGRSLSFECRHSVFKRAAAHGPPP